MNPWYIVVAKQTMKGNIPMDMITQAFKLFLESACDILSSGALTDFGSKMAGIQTAGNTMVTTILPHPGTQQMIEWYLSAVGSLAYSGSRNLLIYQGIWHFFTSCFSAIWSWKSPLKTSSGCLSENTSKSPFQIVLHCLGVCIFPSNSLALAILPAPAWGSDLLR